VCRFFEVSCDRQRQHHERRPWQYRDAERWEIISDELVVRVAEFTSLI